MGAAVTAAAASLPVLLPRLPLLPPSTPEQQARASPTSLSDKTINGLVSERWQLGVPAWLTRRHGLPRPCHPPWRPLPLPQPQLPQLNPKEVVHNISRATEACAGGQGQVFMCEWQNLEGGTSVIADGTPVAIKHCRNFCGGRNYGPITTKQEFDQDSEWEGGAGRQAAGARGCARCGAMHSSLRSPTLAHPLPAPSPLPCRRAGPGCAAD